MAKPTDIELTVGLVPGDVKNTARELGKSIKEVFDSTAGKTLDEKMMKLQQRMSQTASKAEALREKMAKLETTKVPTEEYAEIAKQIEKTEAQIAKMQEKWDKAQEIGAPLQGKQLEQFRYEAAQLENTLEYAKQEMDELVASGKDFTLGTDTPEYQKLSADLANVNNESRILLNSWDVMAMKENAAAASTQQLDNETKNLSKSCDDTAGAVERTNKRLDKMTGSLKKSTAGLFGFGSAAKSAKSGVAGLSLSFGSGLKKLLKYAFGIGSLMMLFNKFRAAAKEGIKSLVLWEGQNGRLNKSISNLMSAISTLKNNIGAMVAPLINALAPAITRIIELISAAIQKISMFIAMISGQKTFLVANKVQENYAASLDKTASSAKKAEKALKGYLSPIDEINKFQSQSDNAAGGGGGGGAGAGFTEMPIDPKMLQWLERMKKLLEPIINKLKEMWGYFKKGFFEGLGDPSERLARLKKGLDQIKQAAKDIWSDPEVQKAADNYLNSLAHMLGALAGSVASIGLTIATNLVGGLGDYLADNTDRIKQYIIDMFDIKTEINDSLATLFTDIAYVFESFASEEGIAMTSAIIGIFADAFMGVTELAAKLGRDIVNFIVVPFDENKEHLRSVFEDSFGYLADIFEELKELVDQLMDQLNTLYDDHLKPAYDSMAAGISDIVSAVLDAWDQYISPVWNDITTELGEFSDNYLSPLLTSIMNFLEPVIDLIKLLWDNILQPFVKWIATSMTSSIGGALKVVWELFKTVGSIISTVVTTILDTLGALLKFVVEGFTIGWSQAWENMKERFSNIWSSMKNMLLGVVNSLIDTLNAFFDWISNKVNSFTSGINSVTGWISDKTGWNIATSIPSISIAHVPHLAQGGVIPPNKEFMAVLGDQKQGTNIETPLSTMIEAFNTALQQNGGAGGIKQINFLLPSRQVVASYTIEGGKIIQTKTGRNPFELA